MLVSFMAFAMVACDPPPEPVRSTSATGITLLHPPTSPPEVALSEDGSLSFLVVVDIDGLIYVEPNTKESDIDGEGHWHVNVNGAYLTAPVGPYFDYYAAPGTFVADDPLELRVTLQSNTHLDLDMLDNWQDVAEFVVVPPPAAE